MDTILRKREIYTFKGRIFVMRGQLFSAVKTDTLSLKAVGFLFTVEGKKNCELAAEFVGCGYKESETVSRTKLVW